MKCFLSSVKNFGSCSDCQALPRVHLTNLRKLGSDGQTSEAVPPIVPLDADRLLRNKNVSQGLPLIVLPSLKFDTWLGGVDAVVQLTKTSYSDTLPPMLVFIVNIIIVSAEKWSGK
jgi:hypothetical protein